MESKRVLIDSSVFIDYFRKTQKEKTLLAKVVDSEYQLAISVITQFEIFVGSNPSNQKFWSDLLENVSILPIESSCIETALKINLDLKQKSKQIAFPDLLIASMALSNDLPILTLNTKHFNRIADLELLNL